MSSQDKTRIGAFSHIKELSIHREPYMPGLYYKRPNDLWRNGNQQSSYELSGFIRRYFKNNVFSFQSMANDEEEAMKYTEIKNASKKDDDKWIKHIDDTLKNDQEKYGMYAGNDNWCHHFTDEQLRNFYDLIENTKFLSFE